MPHSSQREPWVVHPLYGNVSGVRILGGSIRTQMDISSIDTNLCKPARASSAVSDAHTQYPGAIAAVAFPILHVDALGNVAQIAETVVSLDAVDVVDIAAGPNAASVKPANAMSAIEVTINSYPEIPVGITGGTDWARSEFSPSTVRHSPGKLASLRIVVKEFANTLCGQFHPFILSFSRRFS